MLNWRSMPSTRNGLKTRFFYYCCSSYVLKLWTEQVFNFRAQDSLQYIQIIRKRKPVENYIPYIWRNDQWYIYCDVMEQWYGMNGRAKASKQEKITRKHCRRRWQCIAYTWRTWYINHFQPKKSPDGLATTSTMATTTTRTTITTAATKIRRWKNPEQRSQMMHTKAKIWFKKKWCGYTRRRRTSKRKKEGI